MAVPRQGRERLPERFDRPPIVPAVVVDQPELDVRFDLERVIAEGDGQRERPLARPQRPLIVAQNPEPIGHLAGDVRQPALVTPVLRQGFGFAQGRQHPSPVPQTPERKVQGQAQIDGLFTHGPTLGQMLQRPQRLLKGDHGLTVG